MIVEIITTGEEVLSGQITDTNAVWLSQLLNEQGLSVHRRTTVGDRLEDLTGCFRERGQIADLIIVNGGLGPTSDDLSAQAMAQALEEPLVEFETWTDVLRERFQKRGIALSAANRKQAMLPRCAEMIPNPVGTACCFAVRCGRARFYFTPGVPKELKRLMVHEILPRIKARFPHVTETHLIRLDCFGLAESNLGETLADIVLPNGITLGYRPHMPTIEIKIMGKGAAALFEMPRIADEIRARVGEYLVGADDESFEKTLQKTMIARGFTLALAESCTGGMIGSRLVNLPGSSAYLDRGYVTYSNQAKMDMLGVPEHLLETHGAVSLEVARSMAVGARQRAQTSHALSVSGIAGPGGGSEEKPVGLVAFSLATPDAVYSQELLLPNWGRQAIRLLARAGSLDMLRRYLADLPIFAAYDFAKTLRTDRGT